MSRIIKATIFPYQREQGYTPYELSWYDKDISDVLDIGGSRVSSWISECGPLGYVVPRDTVHVIEYYGEKILNIQKDSPPWNRLSGLTSVNKQEGEFEKFVQHIQDVFRGIIPIDAGHILYQL